MTKTGKLYGKVFVTEFLDNSNLNIPVVKRENPSVQNREEKIHVNKDALKVFSPIVPVRRLSGLPDEINQGHYAKAAGLAAITAINIPEDTRDLKSAAKQLLTKEYAEHYKVAQVPFSFFRGTCLEPIVNKLGKFGVKLHEWDVPLESTRFGDYVKDKLNISTSGFIPTGRTVPVSTLDEAGKVVLEDVEVFAMQMEGKPFGKLVGNTLLRMPVISTCVMAGLELPSIYNAFSEPEKTQDKIVNGTAQIAKSSVNIAAISTAIGVFGALLKGKGPIGSLVGMGLGSVAGAYLSKQTAEKIDFGANKVKAFFS